MGSFSVVIHAAGAPWALCQHCSTHILTLQSTQPRPARCGQHEMLSPCFTHGLDLGSLGSLPGTFPLPSGHSQGHRCHEQGPAWPSHLRGISARPQGLAAPLLKCRGRGHEEQMWVGEKTPPREHSELRASLRSPAVTTVIGEQRRGRACQRVQVSSFSAMMLGSERRPPGCGGRACAPPTGT